MRLALSDPALPRWSDMVNLPEPSVRPLLPGQIRRLGLPVVPLYASTLFISALLLFWVQPLIAKMMLPLLGGAPAVWNTAMMFFQLVLLAGYGYVHLLTRAVPPARQVWIHGALLLAAATVLPFALGDQTPPTDAATPVVALWLAGRFWVVAGLPFFALSASAPLLQSWFTRTGHATASDPYFLYAASNLGSLVALLAFPLFLEPLTTLSLQSRLWTCGFVALFALLAACALAARQASPRTGTTALPSDAGAAVSASWRERAMWVALAFIPSSLLLGVTAYITTDVASAPLLWVIPLALYLLSFVVVFSRRPLIGMRRSLAGQAASLSFVLLLFMMPTPPLWLVVPAHYLAFFATALVCHGALAARRPAVSQLTEFYFCLSLGGALGGVFNALVAPMVFSSAYEYPLALILACALRAAAAPAVRLQKMDFLLPVAVLAAVVGIISGWGRLDAFGTAGVMVPLVLVVTAVFLLGNRALPFALAVAAVLVPTTIDRTGKGAVEQQRSFFGVHRVKADIGAGILELVHGTTSHGAEFIHPAKWRSQVRYYYAGGPIGQFFTRLRAAHPAPQRVSVTGLGTGALACYSIPGESWTFYEIDPVVVRIARDTRYFHYLGECGGTARIVLGDARLSLKAAAGQRYDVLILDAFSSDAIPMHLLTKDATRLYLDRLAPHGIMLVHISNRNLQLTPMLVALARDLDLAGRHQLYLPLPTEAAESAMGSEWVVLARSQADLAFLDGEPRWGALTAEHPVSPWTDDFSNIVSVLKW
jgi:hypothetical protein